MLGVEDMKDLIYVHDAYDRLNATLLGTEMLIGYNEGILGSLSRIHAVIERNSAEKLKENDYEGVWKIVDDMSLTPEQRAEMLVGAAAL